MDNVPLPASEQPELPGSRRIGTLSADERFKITVILRPRSGHGERFPQRWHHKILSREEFAAVHGADPQDIVQIEAFAKANTLLVEGVYPAKRAIELSGTAADVSKAFQVDLVLYEYEGEQFTSYTGPIYLPAELAPLIQGILSLDNRPIFKPALVRGMTNTVPIPIQNARSAYNFSTGVDGSGQTVGIICLGGGYLVSDISTFFQGLGLSMPTIINVPANGNNPGQNNLVNLEITQDIQMVGAIAPGATIAVYFGLNSSLNEMMIALTAAIHDTVNNPSVISISAGKLESIVGATGNFLLEGAFQDAADHGITVLAPTGDDGSNVGVESPASCPHVTAGGGTVLTLSGGVPVSEVVWNNSPIGATGGGVSDFFDLPPYQSTTGIPVSATNPGRIGRGVPDVASHADSFSGFVFQGNPMAVSGTSATPPLWAGLVALINQLKGAPIGFLNPVLYGRVGPVGALNDILSGTNGAYTAGPGWDACTGWGSPNGNVVANLLPPPSVTGVFPSAGPAGGGTPVTINGSFFIGTTEVNFGNAPVPPLFIVVSDSQISVVGSPAATAALVVNGPVDVTVTTQYGTSTTSSVDQFTYFFTIPNITSIIPSSGSTSGGDPVTILGSGFTGATSVQFGGTTFLPGSFIFNSDSSIAVTTPAVGIPGPVDVTVTTPGLQSAPSQFIFI